MAVDGGQGSKSWQLSVFKLFVAASFSLGYKPKNSWCGAPSNVLLAGKQQLMFYVRNPS